MFVHARNETVRTAMLFRDMAKNGGQTSAFLPTQGPRYGDALKCVSERAFSFCRVFVLTIVLMHTNDSFIGGVLVFSNALCNLCIVNYY